MSLNKPSARSARDIDRTDSRNTSAALRTSSGVRSLGVFGTSGANRARTALLVDCVRAARVCLEEARAGRGSFPLVERFVGV